MSLSCGFLHILRFPTIAHRWRKIELATRCLFKVDYCFTIMSYDGLVYYLLFRYCWGHLLFFNRIISIHTTTSVSRRLKNIMYNVQDYSVLCYNVITLFAWLFASVGILLTFGGICMTASFFPEREGGSQN